MGRAEHVDEGRQDEARQFRQGTLRSHPHPCDSFQLTDDEQAIAWCPWKPDLLATGGTYPDGRIHIWSTSSLSSTLSPAPLETIATDSSVYSLQWSLHAR